MTQQRFSNSQTTAEPGAMAPQNPTGALGAMVQQTAAAERCGKPPQMPHHRLIGYGLALELVRIVARISIRDAKLREQARKSAASAALNAAEGAARTSRADKSRVYAIALAEACEAVAAVEIAGALGACAPGDVALVLNQGVRVKDVLSRLIR